jgi:predicted HD superfamily hydrolase involved in NAD metabolism
LLAKTIQILTDRARATLGEHRLLHLLGATHVATILAEAHGLGAERGALAGLLHDISKPIDSKDIRRDLRAWGTDVPEEDKDFPRVWHGLHAAWWARRELGLDDEAILEAVALHATADAGVGPLCQALFVADFAEPTRRLAETPRLLALARRDLAEGFREAMRLKIAHVRAKGAPIHPRARRAAEAFLPPAQARALLAPVARAQAC